MSPSPDTPTPHPGRIAALDAARAIAVVAMVFGHTLDALLAPAVRAAPALALYWQARGFTAPLFLMVSGWAASVVMSRSGAGGLAVLRARLPRVLLLLTLGYALRWPGWGIDRLLAGDPEVWAHLLAFDALHAVAIALLAAAALHALPGSDRERGLAFLLLVALAVSLGMRSPAPLLPSPQDVPASLPGIAVWQALGGTSPFPVFPWAGYFFAGAALGLFARRGGRRASLVAALTGGALVATVVGITGLRDLPIGHPGLFAYRVGMVLLVLASLSVVPASLAARAAPLGRASLAVYVIHLPIVYGWSTHAGLVTRIGPTLSFGAALAVGALVLAGSVAAQRAVAHARAAALQGSRLAAGLGGAALRALLPARGQGRLEP